MNNSPRNKTLHQSAQERVNNFKEVNLGFDDALMKEEASRCINCKNAPCRTGCPVGINIPAFIKCLTEDDKDGALDVISQSSLLPAICGRVCPQENQCEGKCIRRAKLGGSVAIGALERYVGDYGLKKGAGNLKAPEWNGKKVAVIGSGPSGLACAADCALNGFKVTIFEAFHKAGGVLVYGIPEFRLPKDDVVEKEIDKLKALGVEFRLNTVVGKAITFDELQAEYDAIFIGTGAGLPMFMNIPGENLNGVSSANELLTRANLMQAYKPDAITPIYCGKSIAVIGAGNVAMDAARTAKRIGGGEVYIIYRRGREEMPARAEEIDHAEEEGIKLVLLTNPVEILGQDGKVCGIKCVKMQLGEPDASGRRRPEPIEGSEFVIDVDQVIVALGTSPNPLIRKSCSQMEFSKKGTIIVDEATMATSVDGIYSGGDAVTGAATVILAMGAGRKAAKAIIEKFAK
ncbi:MAG: NADPH-dependent glutamate synthase [Clostridia bacterium]|nr:NADPH-dependent glutamate synthase [Clostridia bacterium]MDE7328386.1 NADPH-dependent glutamate synthase [Clostridia bacterium]